MRPTRLLLLLAAALMVAAASATAASKGDETLTFDGSLCTCDVEVTDDPMGSTTQFTASCKSSPGFGNTLEQCDCGPIALPCPEDGLSRSFVVQSAQEHHCATMGENRETPCEGEPCPNRGVSTKITVVDSKQKSTTGVVSRSCSKRLEVHSCTTTKPCSCQISSYKEEGTCSKTCGEGTMKETATILQAPSNGGTECPPTERFVPCQIAPCPVDCVLSSWSPWTACNVKCGEGEQTSNRRIVTKPEHGGAECESPLDRVQTCTGEECAKDCEMSPWIPSGSCSQPCGGGLMEVSRVVISGAEHGGQECGATKKHIECNTQACPPIDCEVSEWSGWSECSVACGGGTRNQTRTITVPEQHGGEPCPPLTRKENCNEHVCPVDCVQSEWLEWGECTTSATCGTGERHRSRVTLVEAKGTGKACEPLVQTESCEGPKCPINCTWSAWGDWSPCDADCGTGKSTRDRVKLTEAAHGGTCGQAKEERLCNEFPCPKNCVGSWGGWGECDAACGGGSQSRTYTVSEPAEHGGSCLAEEHRTEYRECNLDACPIDCEWGEFGNWTTCSLTCGGGSQHRTRPYKRQAQYGGKQCDGDTVEYRECNLQACPCEWTWSDWSECSAPCGGGTQARTATVTSNGAGCPKSPDSRSCNDHCCAVDCVAGEWGKYGACSAKCEPDSGQPTATGSQVRTRNITTPNSCGGAACPSRSDTTDCTIECPCRKAKESDFSAWTDCSKTCGMCMRTRTFKPKEGEKVCQPPASRLVQHIPQPLCKCQYTEWSNSTCSATCDSEVAVGTIKATRQAKAEPERCDDTTREIPCAKSDCKCKLSEWKHDECSEPCGGGVRHYTRTITANPSAIDCKAELSKSEPCNEQACCVYEKEWGNYSVCNPTTKLKTRSKKLTSPSYDGKTCTPEIFDKPVACGSPGDSDTQPPAAKKCEYDEHWATCEPTCGKQDKDECCTKGEQKGTHTLKAGSTSSCAKTKNATRACTPKCDKKKSPCEEDDKCKCASSDACDSKPKPNADGIIVVKHLPASPKDDAQTCKPLASNKPSSQTSLSPTPAPKEPCPDSKKGLTSQVVIDSPTQTQS